MVNLEKLRLPYREDTAFGLLALAVFVIPLAFSYYAYENFESVKFSLFLLCTGGAFAAFALANKGRTIIVKYNKYFYALLLAFFLWAVISSIFSLDFVYSLIGFYYRYTSGLLFYAVFLVFLLLLMQLLDAGRLEYLLKILVLDAFLVALVSYLQSFGWIFYSGLGASAFVRGPSLLGNPDFSAMFLAALLPITVYFFIKSGRLWPRVYYGVVAFSIIVANLILASRATLIAMAISALVALGLLWIFKFPKSLFWALFAVAFLAGVGGNYFLNVSRPEAVSSIASAPDSNTFDRFSAWDVSFKGIAHAPFFGSGPGT
jgi:O-antigen ligase